MSRVVLAVGQIRLGDVGMPPGHIMPTTYGVIVSTMNNPGFKEVERGIRSGTRYNIKLTDNNGVTHTNTVKDLNAGAGWYASITIGDLTKVFTRSSSIAFVVTESTGADLLPSGDTKHQALGTWSLTDKTGRLWQFTVTGTSTNLNLEFIDGGRATGSYDPSTGNGTTFNIYKEFFDSFNVTNSTWTWGKYGTYSLSSSGLAEREQAKAAAAEKARAEEQARIQASAQAAAVAAAQAQARAAAAEAADAASKQRIAQQQLELTRNSDELTKARALAQAQAADLAAAQARSRADAAAASTAQAQAADSGQSVRSHLYTDLGCWKDTPDRAISGGFVGSPGTDAYNTSRCYEVAMSKGHDIFALQAGYACFTGLAMRDNYKKYGDAPGNCEIGGGQWINHVYSINKKDHVVPHEVGSYSDWSVIPSLFSDFQTQSSKLLDSLKFPDTSNPAPYMTALDTNVNAIRDDIKLQEIKALNAQNVKDATQIFKDVTDMNPEFQENRAEAERLRRQILLTSGQTSGYQNKTLPLQILAVTLALVLVVYFLAGFILSPTTASTLAIVLLTVGFGASVYYAFNKQSAPNNNG